MKFIESLQDVEKVRSIVSVNLANIMSKRVFQKSSLVDFGHQNMSIPKRIPEILRKLSSECFSFSVGPKLNPFASTLHFLSGKSIGLTCIVEEGDAPISFHWNKDGISASSLLGMDIVQSNAYSSLLWISEANSNHTGIYSCTATNSVGISRTIVTLEIDGDIYIVYCLRMDHWAFFEEVDAWLWCDIQ